MCRYGNLTVAVPGLLDLFQLQLSETLRQAGLIRKPCLCFCGLLLEDRLHRRVKGSPGQPSMHLESS